MQKLTPIGGELIILDADEWQKIGNLMDAVAKFKQAADSRQLVGAVITPREAETPGYRLAAHLKAIGEAWSEIPASALER